MANIGSLLTFALLYFIKLGLGDSSKLSEEECRALGFTPNLLCNSCKLLEEHNLAALKDDCESCCKADSSSDNALKVYPYAELRVCG
ncbi:SEP15-like protein [Mya arenaria]|uniref:SEP15-like protein n=2 Tax=Mya arenaria TaxID=6604 RepID=A0ABY7GAU5_MYAAR|nr:SEP15-like protein [Mya arenaria]